MKKYRNITYTFNDILFTWLNNKKDIKIQSRLNYEMIINRHISNSFGNIKLKKISKSIIEDFFDSLNKESIAISTQKKLIYIIKSGLLFSYENKLIDFIDLSNIKFRSPKRKVTILTKNEQHILEENLKSKLNIRKVCLLLCLYTGLRVGEVCGLKWEDIDFNNKYLIIRRTIERIKNKDKNINSKTILIESTPKSDTSNRIVPIPEFLIMLLKHFKDNDKYYLLSKSEKLYDPRLFESFYARLLKSCNINKNKFHTLRHTFATRSIESKMDIKTLSEILGHSSVEITLKLYVHPSYELKKASIENLVEFMTN